MPKRKAKLPTPHLDLVYPNKRPSLRGVRGQSKQEWDSNPRPTGYEPVELPLLYPAACKAGR